MIAPAYYIEFEILRYIEFEVLNIGNSVLKDVDYKSLTILINRSDDDLIIIVIEVEATRKRFKICITYNVGL